MRRTVLAATIVVALGTLAEFRLPVIAKAPTAGVLEYVNTPQKTMPSNGCTSITPSGTAFAYSGWVEFTASTATDVVFTGVAVDPAVNGGEWLLDLGVGAAAAETTFSFVFSHGESVQESNTASLYINTYPGVHVAAGSRVAARMRKFGTSTTAWCFALTYIELPHGGNAVYSTATSAYGGIGVTPNAGSWVDSSWVQLAASTATDIDIYRFTNTWTCPGGPAGYDYEWDIGVGAAASEVVKRTIRNAFLDTNGICTLSGGHSVTNIWPPLHVTSGQRVAVRLRKSNTDTVQRFPTLAYQANQSLPTYYTTQPSTIVPAAAAGLSVVSGVVGPAWVVGSYVEFIASTASPIAITDLIVRSQAVSDEFEYEIGVGAASTEVVVGTFRLQARDSRGDFHYSIRPAINVGTGQRVAMRIRDSTASARTQTVSLGYISNPDFDQRTNNVHAVWPPAADGVTVTPHGTAWNNSNWTQLVASTSADVLITDLTFFGQGTVPRGIEIDLGVGAAASEVVLTTARTHMGGLGGSSIIVIPFTYPQFVPSGSRVAVRMRGSGTSTSNFLFAANYVPYTSTPGGGVPKVSTPVLGCCWPFKRAEVNQERRRLVSR